MSSAVVLMAYGSPERLVDVPAYYADIRGGRPIAPEHLEDLVARYRQLGIEASNPLNAITEETRRRLAEALGLPVFTGMKHWSPRIADAAAAALEGGAGTVVGLVLAPHYSQLSIAGYQDQLERSIDGGARLEFVDSWHDDPGFISLLADRIRGTAAHVVFTAHSLPARILDQGDPYRDQLLETAALVAGGAGVDDWSFSFQSESPTGEPWLGPDILDHLAALHEHGTDDVLVCPIGFVSDHLEIRWDIDTEARDKARELGMRLDRIEMPNADPRFIEVLATIVRGALGTLHGHRENGRAEMKPGQIVVDRVSQRFRVSERPYRTLKDMVVARRRTGTSEIWALRDVSLRAEPGEAVGLVGRNGSGKTTLLRLISGIFSPTSGRIETGGRIGSLLELGAGFHPDFTGRENVYLNGSIHGLSRARVRVLMDEIVAFAELERAIDLPVRTYSSGMYMRLGFSVAAHIRADVLLLDEVFAVGDEAFQRKCFGKIHEFKLRGGTIVFVSHDAQAVERLCDRAVLLRQGEVVFDGETREAIAEYRRLLAGERSPDEVAAGLREWGSGEAHIVSARIIDSDGDERQQFASGEAAVIQLAVASQANVPPPRVSLELRDGDGVVLGGVSQATAELGWGSGAGERDFRFEIGRLPLADGHFHVRCALIEADGGRLLHSLDDAVRFFVFPAGTETGAVLLEGSWTMQEIAPPTPIGQP